MAKSKPQLAKYLLQRLEGMKQDRIPYEAVWDQIRRYILPFKGQYGRPSTPGQNDVGLFDGTASRANSTYSSGMLAYLTPGDGKWFSFAAPRGLPTSDAVNVWLQKCTEIAQNELAKSNFYAEIQELFDDDGGYGTTVLFCLEGRNKPLTFESLANSSFWLAENDEGEVDTIFRQIDMTVEQITAKFGEENLHEKMRDDLEKFRKNGTTGSKATIIHAVFPRDPEDIKPKKTDGQNKPIASVYLDVANKHILRLHGFDEMPGFASRHRKASGEVYGYAPGWVALPDVRQLNYLTMNLDLLCEVKVNPRLLLPNTMAGEVDMDAGGATFFDPNNPYAKPEPWLDAGDYNVGLERERNKAEAINSAYHVDLFQMFAQLDKQMTAREVAERSGEKLLQFTPAFALKATELLTPLLRRVFSILYNGGLFPEAPEEAAIDEGDGPAVPIPDVGYNSRLALAIKAQQNIAWARTLESIIPLIEVYPGIIDNYEIDTIARESALNDGLPAHWLKEVGKRDAEREASAQAAAQQQQLEQAAIMAQAAGNAAKVKPDSVIAQGMPQ